MAASAGRSLTASESAYYASGCMSLTDFLSSSLCQGARSACIANDVSSPLGPVEAGKQPVLETLHFSLNLLRAREDPGSFASFFHALCTTVPSCTALKLFVELASLDELVALCRGIASPLCTLRSLHLNAKLSSAHHPSADSKCLVGDALACNSSIQQLFVVSDLFCPNISIPSFLYDLHVELVGDDTLDVLLGIFDGLACNSISLTTISITGKYDDTSDYMRGVKLDSEKQLGMLLLTNTSLTSLHFYNVLMPYDAFEALFISLNQSPNITDLTLCGYLDLPGEVVRMLFTTLETNPHLTSLCLSYNGGEDWPSASWVLDRVRINGVLSKLELDETPLEEETEDVTWEGISAQFEMNGRNLEQKAVSKS